MFQTACLNILFQLLLPNPEDTVEWFDCKVPQIARARQTWAMQRWLECMVWRHKPCTRWQAMGSTSHTSMPCSPWVSSPGEALAVCQPSPSDLVLEAKQPWRWVPRWIAARTNCLVSHSPLERLMMVFAHFRQFWTKIILVTQWG